MDVTRRGAITAGAGAALATVCLSSPRAEFDGPLFSAVEGGEEFWLATDAYVYGYPLVTMEMTRRVMTNAAVAEKIAAPWANSLRRAPIPTPLFVM